MTVKELVKVICEKRGLSTPQLAEGAEINPNTLRTTLNRNYGMGMTVEKFLDWMERMDLQVVIEDIEDGEEYILDGEFEDI